MQPNGVEEYGVDPLWAWLPDVHTGENAVKNFFEKHTRKITGAIGCLERSIFKGISRSVPHLPVVKKEIRISGSTGWGKGPV